MIVIEPQYAILSTSYIIMTRLHVNRWMLEASSPSSIRQTEELLVVVVDCGDSISFLWSICFFFFARKIYGKWKFMIFCCGYFLLLCRFTILPFLLCIHLLYHILDPFFQLAAAADDDDDDDDDYNAGV